VRRVLGWLAAFIALGLVSLPLVLAILAWRQPDRLSLPVPTGPYPVGRVMLDWRDDARIDPFAPAPATARELPVCIWYPAAKGSDATRVEYMPPRLREAMTPDPAPPLWPLMQFLNTDRAGVTSHALAAPPSASGTFPVVILKPNLGGAVAQNSVLAEELASHGYIVVGSDSPHTTPGVAYQDGRIVRRTAAGHPSESAPGRVSPLAPGQPNDSYLPVVDVWVKDNRFVLDRLEAINAHDPGGRFTGRFNLSSIGALGHSLGGATALQFCHEDSRCTAVVDVDGMPYGDVVVNGIAKPFLFIAADRPIFHSPASTLDSGGRAFIEALTRIRRKTPHTPSLVLVQGAEHFNFFDQAILTEPTLWRPFGALGSGDQTRLLEVTRRYVLAFFDTYLKGSRDALLDKASADYPEVRFP
jgi:dienelactone hydrolase